MAQRLLQHRADDGARSVIFADGDQAWFLNGVSSTRELAHRAIAAGRSLVDEAAVAGMGAGVDIAAELSAGRLLAPIDHEDPAHLWMTGTGLTHLGSAEGRNKMHAAAASGEKLTDSMRMFLEGVEGGKPAAGQVGQQPEWFYKGDGSQLSAPAMLCSAPPLRRMAARSLNWRASISSAPMARRSASAWLSPMNFPIM
jgi:hypothetical protein